MATKEKGPPKQAQLIEQKQNTTLHAYDNTDPLIGKAAITFSEGESTTDVHPKALYVDSFEDFCKHCLSEAGRSSKKGCKYVCGPLDPKITNEKGSVRCKGAALRRKWTALDVDGCSPSETKALGRWARQYRGFAYTTSSDTNEKRRFRVVWELERPVSRDEGIALGRWILRELKECAPNAKLDDCLFRNEHPLFLPLTDAGSKTWLDRPPMPVTAVAAKHAKTRTAPALRSMDATPLEGLTLELAAEVLQQLGDDWGAPGSGTWYQVAAALHLQFEGSEDAYRVLDEWSQDVEGYDEEANRQRWDAGFSHSGEVRTMRTFVREALQNDWVPADEALLETWRMAAVDYESDAKGNAEWLLDRVGERYLNLRAEGSAKECHLLVYNGRHWQFGNDLSTLKVDMARLETYWSEQADAAHKRGNEAEANWLRNWARKCRTPATIDNTAWHLKRDPSIGAHLDDFDAQPNVLAVRNGVIDLDTGLLLPHSPLYRTLSYIDIEYDKDADAPLWMGLLEHASGGNAEWIDFLHRVLGYSISGHTQEQKMFFLHGLPSTGKSTIVEALRDILGSKYVQALASRTVCASAFPGERYELADLIGKRIAVVPEVNDREQLDVELLKRLTGNDTIPVRRIRGEPFEFRPRVKLFLVGNSLPPVDSSNEPFWRRVQVVPFNFAVPPDKRDRELSAKLHREAQGILAWLVRGYARWRERDLSDANTPEVIRTAVANYRAKTDPKEAWYAHWTKPTGKTGPRRLYESYKRFLATSEFASIDPEDIESEKAFGQWLDQKGHSVVRSSKGRFRQSISLRAE